jgi:hypothetical protein
LSFKGLQSPLKGLLRAFEIPFEGLSKVFSLKPLTGFFKGLWKAL